MKPEPLKGKWNVQDWREVLQRVENDENNHELKMLFKNLLESADEVKSAVKWLKNEISAMNKTKGRTNKKVMEFAVLNLIDEAFEDVVK